eukprot:9492919-Pyramimonas_sp.AAC.1
MASFRVHSWRALPRGLLDDMPSAEREALAAATASQVREQLGGGRSPAEWEDAGAEAEAAASPAATSADSAQKPGRRARMKRPSAVQNID